MSDLSPFLNIGMTLAIFNSAVNMPVLKIWFIIIASGFNRLFCKVLICFVDKLSQPQLVLLVRPFIIFKVVFSATCSKRKVSFVGVRRKCLKVILSTILSSNFGQISVKYILNWFAISVLLCIFSPSTAIFQC